MRAEGGKSNVVALPKKSGGEPEKKLSSDSEKKWGKRTMKCKFCIVPALLLRAQGRLGISPTQLAIILQIMDYWWNPKAWPWVSKADLAARLNISEKIIQRNLKELEDAGLVRRVTRVIEHRRRANGYDLEGLVNKLDSLAPEFIEAAEAKKKAEKRGGTKNILARAG